jgi:hypothetical protein
MKQETLEEAAKNYAEEYKSEEQDPWFDFMEGAKWQQERSYNEEDLKEAFKGGGKMSWSDMNQETQEPYYYDFNEWFEQFNKTILNNKI